MSLLAFDFFCGVGGLTRGLQNAGMNVVAGIDIDSTCKESYETNNSPSKFICSDIREFDTEIINTTLEDTPAEDLLFAGCAPCQAFSKQRKSKVRRPDATVLGAFSEIVKEFRPGFVMIENVPGLRRIKGFSTYRRFKKTLEDCGYMIAEGVLDAKQFGTPQTRRRLILIASRFAQPELPAPKFGKGLDPYLTVRDAISHFPPIDAGSSHSAVRNHTAAEISEKNLSRLKVTPHDGGDRRDWPRDLWLDCHSDDYTGHTDVYGRMHWDRPAPTLTGRCISISNGRFGHPVQDRAITLREAAALQTFDDDYEFSGNFRKIALHIGNAVPVILAEEIGNEIRGLWELSKVKTAS